VTDAAAELADAEGAGPPPSGYGRGARILSIGIAATGLFTFLYFAVASHVLGAEEYGEIALLWSILFVVLSVLYRPVEQLLSRTIADRRARGLHHGHPLRIPLALQGGIALTFLVVALAARAPLEDLLGSAALFWIFTGAALAYAASYFARGYFAGHQWFALYGGLVLFEALSRVCFPLAVAAGVATGQTAVALGILAAPLASLLVVPWAIARHSRLDAQAPPPDPAELTLRAGGGFALAVGGIQLGEQALLNGGVIVADGVADAAVAGAVFNALLITRAPLQLFQAIQTSLLPHLAGLEATEGHEAFGRAIRVTVLAIAGFAGAVAFGLLAIGPWVMEVVFGDDTTYGRAGLMVVAVGMGLHLAAGTLNQAALARGRAAAAATAWLLVAAGFLVWMTLPVVDDVLLRAQIGYAGAAAVLCAVLYALYRRDAAAP
jgi:O-antigen/teichoic acid export membrane protein